jgi:hypothetical protein
MKMFAAITEAEIVRKFYEKTEIKLNYLISYYYLEGQAYKLVKEYREMREDLYLDSGAYSVETGRSKISITEYLRYLKLYGEHFDQYFNLDDKFDDSEHNENNQYYLDSNLPSFAKRPIPVVHDDENPFADFRGYADMEHDFIAIGSKTKLSDETIKRIKEEYPSVRIHIFGQLDIEWFKKYKPYSADAATWAHAAGFGDIYYWDPDENEHHKIYMGTTDRKDNDSVHFKKFAKREKVETFLKDTFGYQYSDLLPKSGAEARYIVNLYFYKQVEDYLTSLKAS